MPSVTALLHTQNDALRLGRCLETLYPCDEIVIVDHASRDLTVRIAREYGAKVVRPVPGASPNFYVPPSDSTWLLCLAPCESLSEGLAASLFEWKELPSLPSAAAFSVLVRDEAVSGWADIAALQTRLVSSRWKRWEGTLPTNDPSAAVLEGELLHFVLP